MQEQIAMVERLNDFLERRGLRANYVADQVGIGRTSFYVFKSGHKLLTRRQLQKLQDFMVEYDLRLSGFSEGGNNAV